MSGSNAARGGLESLALASLVGQVCHDLNNHLASLLGKTELALMVDDAERYRPALEQTLEAGQPARALVAELQRIVLWVRDGEPGVPATDAVGVAARLCERGCAKRGIRLSVRSEVPGLRLQDPGRVAVTCWNLLDRLVRAQPMANGSELQRWTVTVRPERGGVRLRVEAEPLQLEDPDLRESLRELSDWLPWLGGELSSEAVAVELSLADVEQRSLPGAGGVRWGTPVQPTSRAALR